MAKTNDYESQGLNRGNSTHFEKPMKEGVVYGERAKKWLVRIMKNGNVCTMAGFVKKEDAERRYAALCGE